MARLITKGLIGVEDLAHGLSTYTRATSTGGTQVLHSIAGIPTGNIFFVDGVNYTTVALAVAAAVTAGGGTVDARGSNSAAALALGTIDAGNSGPGVTILLGPFVYTATKIVMRSGTKIYGTGRANAGSTTGTTINMSGTTGPLITFNTNASTDDPAQGVVLDGVFLQGAASGVNTANAMLFDASTSTTGFGGVWYSRFSNINIQNFGGHTIYFKGPIAGGANGDNQWITFENVSAFRPTGGAGNALRIEGTNNFLSFLNCVFDSPFGGIDLTGSALNVFIGGPAAGTTASIPNIIKFYDCAIEGSGTGVQIDGGSHITFDHCHHENTNGVYLITYNVNGTAIQTMGLEVFNCSFNSSVGVNGGNGYLVKLDSTAANKVAHVQFHDNIYLTNGSAQPDNWILNPTNGVGINDYNNAYGGGNAQGIMRNQVATPTTTVKAGTASGVNYTTASTSFVAVDNTNLTYTAVVPVGWKLICMAAFQQSVDTASVQVLARIQDTTGGGTTLAISDVIPALNTAVGVSLIGVLTGDGVSHTVRLEYKTTAGADTTEIINSTSGTPQLVFILAPSN